MKKYQVVEIRSDMVMRVYRSLKKAETMRQSFTRIYNTPYKIVEINK